MSVAVVIVVFAVGWAACFTMLTLEDIRNGKNADDEAGINAVISFGWTIVLPICIVVAVLRPILAHHPLRILARTIGARQTARQEKKIARKRLSHEIGWEADKTKETP